MQRGRFIYLACDINSTFLYIFVYLCEVWWWLILDIESIIN